jgi:predicted small lipoprotein YifL
VQRHPVLSRRALLGLTAVAIAGCGKHKTLSLPPKPVVVPDAAALAAARNIEASLLASYDAKIARASPRQRAKLEVERAIHATHLSALHGTMRSAVAIPASKHLEVTLHASVASLRRFALKAQAGTNAALLASIAASHDAITLSHAAGAR